MTGEVEAGLSFFFLFSLSLERWYGIHTVERWGPSVVVSFVILEDTLCTWMERLLIARSASHHPPHRPTSDSYAWPPRVLAS